MGGSDRWVDNFIIRNYRTTEPEWGEWTDAPSTECHLAQPQYRFDVKGVVKGNMIITTHYLPFRHRDRFFSLHKPDSDGPLGWSGRFLTVGTGKQYPVINTALAAATNGDMLLVYGTHTATEYWTYKRVFIRGMGSTPSDTIIYGFYMLSFGSPANVFIENLTIYPTGNWPKCITIFNSAKVTANKVRLYGSDSDDYAIGGKWFDPKRDNTTLCTFQNCYLYRGYSHLCYLNLNNIALIKSQLNNTLNTYNCSGTLSTNDTVTTATVGYGADYGDLVITDLFLSRRGML